LKSSSALAFALLVFGAPVFAQSPQVAPPTPIAPPGAAAPSAPAATTPVVPPVAPSPQAVAEVPSASGEAAEKAEPALDDLLTRALTPDPSGLTSEELVAQALQHSPALSKANIQTNKTEATAARAKLLLFPRLDLSARYTRLSKVDLPPLNIGGMTQPNPFPQILDQYNLQASARFPITDLFLTLLPAYKGAKLSEDVSRAEEDARRMSVAYDTRIAFLGYLRARGAVAVRQDSVRVLEANAEDLRQLVGAGAATRTDLALTEARAQQARLALAQTLGQMEVGRVRLSRLTGKEVDSNRGIGENFVDQQWTAPEAADLLEDAFAKRPELKAFQALRRVREKIVSARRGAQAPSLSATGNVYYANPNQRIFPLTEEFNTTWDVGLALSWSPNDLATARSQMSDAEFDLQTVDEDLRAIEDSIAIEAASAVIDLKLAAQAIQATRQNAAASAGYYEDQHALMMAGAATPGDVLEAEQRLRLAQLECVDAYIQAKMAQATLLKVRGQTTPNGQPRNAP
jgi:outer membrane protein TolC